MATQTVMWKTADGKLFEKESDATIHESMEGLVEDIASMCKRDNMASKNTTTVILFFKRHCTEIADSIAANVKKKE